MSENEPQLSVCLQRDRGFVSRHSGDCCILCGARRLVVPSRIQPEDVDVYHLIDRMAYVRVSMPAPAAGRFLARVADGCETVSRFHAERDRRFSVPVILHDDKDSLGARFLDTRTCDRILGMEPLDVELAIEVHDCFRDEVGWHTLGDGAHPRRLVARRTFDPHRTPIAVCIDWGNTNLCIYSGDADSAGNVTGLLEIRRGRGWTYEYRRECSARSRIGNLAKSALAPLYDPDGRIARACIAYKDPAVIDEERVTGVKRAFYYGRFYTGFGAWVNARRQSFTGRELGEKFLESLVYHALYSCYWRHCRVNEHGAVPPAGIFFTHPVGVPHGKLEEVRAMLCRFAGGLLGGDGPPHVRGVLMGPDEATASLLGSLDLIRDDLERARTMNVLVLDAGGSTTDFGIFEVAVDDGALRVRPLSFGCCVRGGDDVTWRIYQSFVGLLRHNVLVDGDDADARRLRSRLQDLAERTKTHPNQDHALAESFDALGLRAVVAAYDVQRQYITFEPDFTEDHEMPRAHRGIGLDEETAPEEHEVDDDLYLRAAGGKTEIDFARRILPVVWNDIRQTLTAMAGSVEQIDRVIFSGQGAELDILRRGVRDAVKAIIAAKRGPEAPGLIRRMTQTRSRKPAAPLSDEEFLKLSVASAPAEQEAPEEPAEDDALFRKHKTADDAKKVVSKGALIYHCGRYGDLTVDCRPPQRLLAPLRIMDGRGRGCELHAAETGAAAHSPFQARPLHSDKLKPPADAETVRAADAIVFRHTFDVPAQIDLARRITVSVNYAHSGGAGPHVTVAEYAEDLSRVRQIEVGYRAAQADDRIVRAWFLRVVCDAGQKEMALELGW